MEERCYVIYGNGFDSVKIKGLENRKKYMEKLKKQGLNPKYSQLNPNSKNGRNCKTFITEY